MIISVCKVKLPLNSCTVDCMTAKLSALFCLLAVQMPLVSMQLHKTSSSSSTEAEHFQIAAAVLLHAVLAANVTMLLQLQLLMHAVHVL